MSARFLIIIRAVDREWANALAKESFDPQGGEYTFTVPLFAVAAESDATPTHYVCSAEVSLDHVPLLHELAGQFTGSLVAAYDLAMQPNFYRDTLASHGLRVSNPKFPI